MARFGLSMRPGCRTRNASFSACVNLSRARTPTYSRRAAHPVARSPSPLEVPAATLSLEGAQPTLWSSERAAPPAAAQGGGALLQDPAACAGWSTHARTRPTPCLRSASCPHKRTRQCLLWRACGSPRSRATILPHSIVRHRHRLLLLHRGGRRLTRAPTSRVHITPCTAHHACSTKRPSHVPRTRIASQASATNSHIPGHAIHGGLVTPQANDERRLENL